jgi:uncharacterized phiE125 gp8 family phage protein
MKFTVTTPPALDPLSIEEVKTHCRVTSVDEDGLIAGYILAARQYVESICGLALITQTITAYFDSFYGIWLPRWPVQSVSSVSYLDSTAVSQPLATDVYYADVRARPAFIAAAYSQCWPQSYYQQNAVTVVFVAGYGATPGSIPEPIRQAMLMLIGHWYENRESATTAPLTDAPTSTKALLAPYRVFF